MDPDSEKKNSRRRRREYFILVGNDSEKKSKYPFETQGPTATCGEITIHGTFIGSYKTLYLFVRSRYVLTGRPRTSFTFALGFDRCR